MKHYNWTGFTDETLGKASIKKNPLVADMSTIAGGGGQPHKQLFC